MAASRPSSSKYQRDQRITAISWLCFFVVGGLLIGLHSWVSDRDAFREDASAPPVGPSMSMHEWFDQSQPSINVLVTARNNIAAAASHQDIPATGKACQVAGEAVEGLRGHMPSPEAGVNQALQLAIDNYTVGLPDCVSASRTVDGEGMQRAAHYISYGDAAMQAALDDLENEDGPTPGGLGVLIV